MGEFTYEKDADGIVIVTMNMDGPVNSMNKEFGPLYTCLLYTSPSPRDQRGSRMPSSA